MEHIQIGFPVGPRQLNQKQDVRTIQALLNSATQNQSDKLSVDGIVGPKTIARIRQYQANIVKLDPPDGIISPHGVTLRSLHFKKKEKHIGPQFHSSGNVITEDYFIEAAHTLKCEVAAVKAIAMTETKGSPFLSPGKPYILYERHIFSSLTNNRFDTSHPDISAKEPYPHYGTYNQQYIRLDEARKLDENAALESASWGAFQILGRYYKRCGFNSIQQFVSGMKTIDGQFYSFINFINSDNSLLNALQQKSWRRVAYIYNGRAYYKKHYDIRLANNYQLALSA